MAQSGKKNLALFQTLRKEMAAKGKAVGKADVPNLQESVVEVHISMIALHFSGLASMPRWVNMKPRNLPRSTPNTHLSGLRRRLYWQHGEQC